MEPIFLPEVINLPPTRYGLMISVGCVVCLVGALKGVNVMCSPSCTIGTMVNRFKVVVNTVKFTNYNIGEASCYIQRWQRQIQVLVFCSLKPTRWTVSR